MTASRIIFLVICAGLAAAPEAARSERLVRSTTEREQQWLYRDGFNSDGSEPTAIFLSWDYRDVIFSAVCDRKKRDIVIRARVGNEALASAARSLEIGTGTSSIPLKTEVIDGYFEGRTKLTKNLERILKSDADLEVFIPNDMSEPWYVGRAQPLRQIGLGCSDRSPKAMKD